MKPPASTFTRAPIALITVTNISITSFTFAAGVVHATYRNADGTGGLAGNSSTSGAQMGAGPQTKSPARPPRGSYAHVRNKCTPPSLSSGHRPLRHGRPAVRARARRSHPARLRTGANRAYAARPPSCCSKSNQLARAYASTVRATVRREGEWPNLSYPHHLGYGARRLAALALRAVTGFSELFRTLLGDEEYTEAWDLVSQAERALTSSYDELLRKVQLMGQTIFRQELKTDITSWEQCDSEWRQAPGYRNRGSLTTTLDGSTQMSGKKWSMSCGWARSASRCGRSRGPNHAAHYQGVAGSTGEHELNV